MHIPNYAHVRTYVHALSCMRSTAISSLCSWNDTPGSINGISISNIGSVVPNLSACCSECSAGSPVLLSTSPHFACYYCLPAVQLFSVPSTRKYACLHILMYVCAWGGEDRASTQLVQVALAAHLIRSTAYLCEPKDAKALEGCEVRKGGEGILLNNSTENLHAQIHTFSVLRSTCNYELLVCSRLVKQIKLCIWH